MGTSMPQWKKWLGYVSIYRVFRPRQYALPGQDNEKL
jgi:hypothetical protein